MGVLILFSLAWLALSFITGSILVEIPSLVDQPRLAIAFLSLLWPIPVGVLFGSLSVAGLSLLLEGRQCSTHLPAIPDSLSCSKAVSRRRAPH